MKQLSSLQWVLFWYSFSVLFSYYCYSLTIPRAVKQLKLFIDTYSNTKPYQLNAIVVDGSVMMHHTVFFLSLVPVINIAVVFALPFVNFSLVLAMDVSKTLHKQNRFQICETKSLGTNGE